jgi:N-terminal acetyltransferase B complex catalytic subunit
MSSIERMSPLDLLDLNLTNLDPLTENYDLGFYLNYLNKWPSLFSTVKDHDAGIVGYSTLSSSPNLAHYSQIV